MFVDEKTFKAGEVKERIGDYGYAYEGCRVPLRYAHARGDTTPYFFFLLINVAIRSLPIHK